MPANSSQTLFINAQILGSSRLIFTGWLLIEAGRIADLGPGSPPLHCIQKAREEIDLSGDYLLPGFIDIHTHGAVGVNFVGASLDEIERASGFFARHGVTGFLLTTWSASPDEIRRTLDTVRTFKENVGGESLLGIHLEGPFINPTRAGAQSPRDIRAAEKSEVLEYIDSGLVRVITLAPEIRENEWLIGECVRRNITVSAGHTDATFAEMEHAVSLGLRNVSHCFNGMRGFSQREPGTVGAALVLPELHCELIADNIHVHPAAMRLLFRAKTADKVILVTDSIFGAGMPDGEFKIQGQRVVFADGKAQLSNGTLAGSLLTMDVGLRNFIEATKSSIETCWVCTSRNPAAAIGLGHHKGRIKKGFDADLVVLDPNLQVKMTYIRGKMVYRNGD